MLRLAPDECFTSSNVYVDTFFAHLERRTRHVEALLIPGSDGNRLGDCTRNQLLMNLSVHHVITPLAKSIATSSSRLVRQRDHLNHSMATGLQPASPPVDKYRHVFVNRAMGLVNPRLPSLHCVRFSSHFHASLRRDFFGLQNVRTYHVIILYAVPAQAL